MLINLSDQAETVIIKPGPPGASPVDLFPIRTCVSFSVIVCESLSGLVDVKQSGIYRPGCQEVVSERIPRKAGASHGQ